MTWRRYMTALCASSASQTLLLADCAVMPLATAAIAAAAAAAAAATAAAATAASAGDPSQH